MNREFENRAKSLKDEIESMEMKSDDQIDTIFYLEEVIEFARQADELSYIERTRVGIETKTSNILKMYDILRFNLTPVVWSILNQDETPSFQNSTGVIRQENIANVLKFAARKKMMMGTWSGDP